MSPLIYNHADEPIIYFFFQLNIVVLKSEQISFQFQIITVLKLYCFFFQNNVESLLILLFVCRFIKRFHVV